jgi:hypothetical protein
VKPTYLSSAVILALHVLSLPAAMARDVTTELEITIQVVRDKKLSEGDFVRMIELPAAAPALPPAQSAREARREFGRERAESAREGGRAAREAAVPAGVPGLDAVPTPLPPEASPGRPPQGGTR